MFTAVSSDIFREVPDRVQIDTTQKRQKTTENQNAMGRQPSLSRTDVTSSMSAWSISLLVIAHPRHELVHYAASTEPPARQVRMAAKAFRPRSIPVSITEQTAA